MSQNLSEQTAKLTLTDIYVDETSGSDTQGTGTKDAPFKTPSHAFSTCASPRILIKQHPEDSAYESVTATHSQSWQEISGAGLKKAKKGWELLKRKQDKEEERLKKEKESSHVKADEEAKRLEASKSIVFKRPKGCKVAVKV